MIIPVNTYAVFVFVSSFLNVFRSALPSFIPVILDFHITNIGAKFIIYAVRVFVNGSICLRICPR
ncbi:hypothetical protein V1478_017769 [Vespula squamosa]|uniref:Uncharacterized protein n=1 Tax=Vespula squamosa TaxID=30214 RepID=A0ABD1ZWR7_VESSQ